MIHNERFGSIFDGVEFLIRGRERTRLVQEREVDVPQLREEVRVVYHDHALAEFEECVPLHLELTYYGHDVQDQEQRNWEQLTVQN